MGYGWTGAFMNKVSLISYMNNEHGLRWAFDSRPVPNFTPLMLVLKFHASTVVDGEAKRPSLVWAGEGCHAELSDSTNKHQAALKNNDDSFSCPILSVSTVI